MSTLKVVKDFTQGDSFTIKISHNPTKNITGGSLVFVMKKRETDTTPILKVTHTVGDNPLDDAANGVAYISVASTDTASIPVGRYFGSIKRIVGTDVFTIIRSDKESVDLIEVFPNLNT
jgi:hypothetical protein